MDTLKKIIQTFAYVLTGITISTALFITIFVRDLTFPITLVWQMIVMSAVCSLGNFIYYYKAVLSKKQMKIRMVCHYLYINLVVLGGAFLWDWLTPGLIPQFLFMLLLIAVVYVVVMITNFHQEEKMAENINRRLRKCYPNEEDGEDFK